MNAFQADTGGFMLNWPYVYAAFQTNIEAGQLDRRLPRRCRLGPLPAGGRQASRASHRSAATTSAISKFTLHPEEAIEFVKCAITPEAELINLFVNGDPPTNATAYDDPEVQAKYPFADLMRESINEAGPRPVTPFYGDVSGSIQRTWHPPDGVNPETTPPESAELISDVINDQRLL